MKASSAVEAAAREAKKAKRKQERQKVSKAFAAKQEEILRQVAEGEGWKLINNLLSKGVWTLSSISSRRLSPLSPP